MSHLLSMSASHMGFIQYPLLQSQTSQQAMIKHRHLLDLAVMKMSLTMKDSMQILYSKPESSSRDSRSWSQPALASFHANFASTPLSESEAVIRGKLGPCPLLRIADLQGYDDDSKPGASARAEQWLGLILRPYLWVCPPWVNLATSPNIVRLASGVMRRGFVSTLCPPACLVSAMCPPCVRNVSTGCVSKPCCMSTMCPLFVRRMPSLFPLVACCGAGLWRQPIAFMVYSMPAGPLVSFQGIHFGFQKLQPCKHTTLCSKNCLGSILCYFRGVFIVRILAASFLINNLRKGIACTNAMMDGLLAGVTFQASDRVYWIDVLPNERLVVHWMWTD